MSGSGLTQLVVPSLEVMLAWHVVIDWTRLELCAAVTKAHSGRDNGELTARVVFITLLFLSLLSSCLLCLPSLCFSLLVSVVEGLCIRSPGSAFVTVREELCTVLLRH